ncbi:MAG: right-handed parallel beta-helix repeat-containing protein [Clostridia bacterium]|nr:right-handed parallel beta-helix repeat-containing protein [Clostridia bacterium]
MKNVYHAADYGVVSGLSELQTEKLQAVFDMCKEEGGTVVIPAGTFRTGGLRMWSDTTLVLEAGARLIGSDVCEDYAVFDVPEDVVLRTDMEMITRYYKDRPWPEYRRSIISVYGGRNIRIIGGKDSLIDGDDCTDPNGEEGYRGPHGIFITNVENIEFEGYTIANCGNFMHQIDNCKNITMRHVTCIGGSDGIHLHCCVHTLIEDCVFHTGDDCIAGINMEDLVVRRCEMNTSCDVFRAGGTDILVEDCRMWGPGIYPHGMTVVQNRGTELVRDKKNRLPRECGRHNLICVLVHFASIHHPNPEPYKNVVFRNCTVENADKFLIYAPEYTVIMQGTPLAEMTLENVTFTGLKEPSHIKVPEGENLSIRLKNVCTDGEIPVFDDASGLTVISE